MLTACKGSSDYSHLTVDLSVEGLTADQRKLLSQIVIQSQPDGNKDPNRVHHVSVKPEQLDGSLSYHFDYIPDPQDGTFVVTAELMDAESLQLALKSEKAELKAGGTATVKFDFASAVSNDGACKPEGDPVEVTSSPQGGESFTVVPEGDHFLMVYSDRSQGNGDLASVELDAMGNAMTTPVFINGSSHVSILPSVVKDGDGYVVAWQEGRADDSPPVTVQLRRLDASGQPVGNIRQVETTAVEARPILATAYGKIAMAWIDDRGTPDAPARVAELAYIKSDDLSFETGPVDLVPSDGAPIHQDAFPALAMRGDSLAVSWVSDTSTVFSANVDDQLNLSTMMPLYSSMFVAQQIDVVSAGDDLFTAWEDLSGEIDKGRERIRGAYSMPDGQVQTGGIIHEIDTGSANWPRLAWNGESVAVVYYQYRDFGSQIFLTRYSPDGTRIDGVDFQFTNVAGQAKYPDIALRRTDLDGDHFGLGWIDGHTGVQRVYFMPVVRE